MVTNKFNSFFTSIGPILSNKILNFGEKFKSHLPMRTENSLFLSPATEIEHELILLSENKASDLPIKLIKIAFWFK